MKTPPKSTKGKLNNSEKVVYSRLEKSATEIKLYKEGKIELQDANEFLNKL